MLQRRIAYGYIYIVAAPLHSHDSGHERKQTTRLVDHAPVQRRWAWGASGWLPVNTMLLPVAVSCHPWNQLAMLSHVLPWKENESENQIASWATGNCDEQALLSTAGCCGECPYC